MTEHGPDQPIVLVVEGDRSVAQQYAEWLDEYEVVVADDSAAALEMVGDWVDVVLLDRAVPGSSGAEVLRGIRDREHDTGVAVVTDVEPDFEIIHMGFDAYLQKPTNAAEVRETVEELLGRAALREKLQEYYSLMSRKGALETWKSEAELSESDGYAKLLERIEAAERAVDESAGDMASEETFVGAVRQLSDDADEEKLEEWDETAGDEEV